MGKTLDLLKSFPQESKHFYLFDRLPPSKYFTEGNKSIFEVHDFPVVEAAAVARENSELVNRFTTNIMDEAIVRDCMKSIHINNYQFNKKGIDFAYTYVMFLMNINKKFPTALHISVDLMLGLFDVFVVYEDGPIMKAACAYLQENYGRLSNIQKAAFVEGVVKKYLEKVDSLPQLKISERYSPLKVLEKLEKFELPMANLFEKLRKCQSRSLVVVLVKLISGGISLNGIKHMELYDVDSGKMKGTMSLFDLITITFNTSLWVLDNVEGIR